MAKRNLPTPDTLAYLRGRLFGARLIKLPDDSWLVDPPGQPTTPAVAEEVIRQPDVVACGENQWHSIRGQIKSAQKAK